MGSLIVLLFFIIEYTAIILLSLSSFRLPIRYNWYKIVFIAAAAAVVSFYIRFGLNQSEFSTLSMITTEIILVFLLFRLPLLFSFLICLIGNFVSATLEVAVIWIGSLIVPNYEELLQTSEITLITCEVIVTILILLMVYFLQKRKIGYHFTTRDSLKGYNFFLSILLIAAVLVLQFQIYSFQANSIYYYVPIISGIIMTLVIYYAYKHNKRLWKERRERLEKK